MIDARQAELAASSPSDRSSGHSWRGVPPAHRSRRPARRLGEAGGDRRVLPELAGITDPAQAIGPVPSGQPDLAETFHASVRALQLPDEAALLRRWGRASLRAVDEADRAIARPGSVQPEIDQRAAEWEDAQVSAT